MAKIAAELDRALADRARRGVRGRAEARPLARGEGWRVEDVVCTSGPNDRPFEERHATVGIAIVAAGTFEYRSAAGRQLMTPGSLLLGNAGQEFECAHGHEAGDRCLAFQLDPGYFERLAADAGVPPRFHVNRLPPLRDLAPFVARALAGLESGADLPWEELGLHLATRASRLLSGLPSERRSPAPSAVARVAGIVRGIERDPEKEPARILDIAFDSGFGDVSNFNRAFRAEFGVSPRAYRAKAGRL